jgi:hypothetical protein
MKAIEKIAGLKKNRISSIISITSRTAYEVAAKTASAIIKVGWKQLLSKPFLSSNANNADQIDKSLENLTIGYG